MQGLLTFTRNTLLMLNISGLIWFMNYRRGVEVSMSININYRLQV